jgi:hypothetical protein
VGNNGKLILVLRVNRGITVLLYLPNVDVNTAGADRSLMAENRRLYSLCVAVCSSVRGRQDAFICEVLEEALLL